MRWVSPRRWPARSASSTTARSSSADRPRTSSRTPARTAPSSSSAASWRPAACSPKSRVARTRWWNARRMSQDFGAPVVSGPDQGLLARLTKRSAATVVWLAKRVALLALVILCGRGIYEFLIHPILDDSDSVLPFLILWVLMAYVLLPRIQRLLTKIYVPDYFIGRARTSEGLLGDPVNLAVNGTEADLVDAMTAGGWTRADELTFRTGFRIAVGAVLRRRYPEAPVSPLFVFSRKQDLAFEQEDVAKPSHRHHVRFWECPEGWYLPGGLRVGWVGAATYDRRVGFSAFTLQITHKIGENVDLERDHVVHSMEQSGGGRAGGGLGGDFSRLPPPHRGGG